MESNRTESRENRYLNPYLGGVLLGLVVIAAFYTSGRGPGATGALKGLIVTGVEAVVPEAAASSGFVAEYREPLPGHPLRSWLVFQMMGLITGGFLSGAFAGRLKFRIEHNYRITSERRLLMALGGGILFGFGSQLGRGCTSGAALSGMSVLSLGGFITMVSIFGTAFALAWFFRKNWI